MTPPKNKRGEGRNWSRPCYNATTPTQRTVVVTLPEEMWALLAETAKEGGFSMREAVSATLVLALEDAVKTHKVAA